MEDYDYAKYDADYDKIIEEYKSLTDHINVSKLNKKGKLKIKSGVLGVDVLQHINKLGEQ